MVFSFAVLTAQGLPSNVLFVDYLFELSMKTAKWRHHHWLEPFSGEVGIFSMNKINIMAADGLTLCVARPSTAMVLIMSSNETLSSLRKDLNNLQYLSVV